MAPRIPSVPDAQLQPADVVDTIKKRRGGKLLNLDRMLLNSPPYTAGWNTFLGFVRTELTLDPKLRELAICAVAVLTRAKYEYDQHAPEFLINGGLQTQLDALRGFEFKYLLQKDSPLFNKVEQATLALAQEMTQKVQVSDACFDAIKECLNDTQQLVELVGVIAAYNMVARFLVALEVADENSK